MNISQALGRLTRFSPYRPRKAEMNSQYWSDHNVTNHAKYASRENSLASRDYRNSQYLFYEELMPTSGFDNKVVLDFGCGPGHDLVGFCEDSKPAKVYGLDVSKASIAESIDRLKLHPGPAPDLILLDDNTTRIPLPDQSVDYIHSSGVLHHIADIDPILTEFRRILKPDGFMRIMVYNYESVFLHLYVAYCIRTTQMISFEGGPKPHEYGKLDLKDAFQRATDGWNCPHSRWYTVPECLEVFGKHGFAGSHIGNAVSMLELKILQSMRFTAIEDESLEPQHRNFLRKIEFDTFGRPTVNGQVAGIDGVYEFRK